MKIKLVYRGNHEPIAEYEHEHLYLIDAREDDQIILNGVKERVAFKRYDIDNEIVTLFLAV
jgi:hypothetical protein